MIARVMNMASEVMTWFGGSCCVPRACSNMLNTTTTQDRNRWSSLRWPAQAEHRQQQHDLDRAAEALGASPIFRSDR